MNFLVVLITFILMEGATFSRGPFFFLCIIATVKDLYLAIVFHTI